MTRTCRSVCVLVLAAAVFTACPAPARQGAEASAARTTEAPVPEIYGAGLFSTGAWDFFMAFSPDQKRVLFCRADDRFEVYALYETRLGEDGRWSAPVKPRFATEWSNADPHISPDGRTVYFISNRPNPGETGPRTTHDIWSASLQPDGEWGEARRLPAPVNDPNVDEWPAIHRRPRRAVRLP